MERTEIADNKYLRYFFYFVLGEIFLMGSGQDLHVLGSSLTFRMFNFVVGMVISLYLFVRNDDFPKAVLGFLLAYLILMIIGYLMGFAQNSDPEYLQEDLRPLLYFFMLLFFYYMMTSELVIKRVLDIMLFCVKVMTVLYLIYMTITDVLGLIQMQGYYYHMVDDSGSFMFRGIGSSLFYKGFVYLPIGAVGFYRRKQWWWFALTVLAIYFTYTRGLYVLLAFGLLMYYLMTKGLSVVKVGGLVLLMLLFYEIAEVFEIFSFDQSFMANRDESDLVRKVTIDQVFDRITWWSVIVGHGFGQGVPERTTHMEISYLDIFHHQGIIGLAFWTALLTAILFYGKAVSEKYREEAAFFMTGAMMIYLQSCFNPFLNNSIGMSLVMLAFVICFRLANDDYLTSRSSI